MFPVIFLFIKFTFQITTLTMDSPRQKWLSTILVNATARGNIDMVKKLLYEVPELDVNVPCHQYEGTVLNAAILTLVKKQMESESQSYGNYSWKI